MIGYQGRLANASGDLLGGSGTTYYFKFSIWSNSVVNTGTKLWPSGDPTGFTATVRQGVFEVNIGDTANGYPDTLDYNFNTNRDVYLQVEVSSSGAVGSYQTLSPRQKIGAAAFAQLAGAVSGTGPSSFGTTTPINNSVVTVEATSTGSVGLTVRGMLGQLANLFQIQDSTGANLFVVNSVGRVGVGTSTPDRRLDVLDTNSSPQLRLSQTGSVFGEFYVDPAGDIQISSTGQNVRLQDENMWVCSGGSCGANAPPENGNLIVETSVILNNNFRIKQTGASTTVMYDPSA